MSESTFARSKALALAARSHLEEMSDKRKPTSWPRKRTVSPRRVDVMRLEATAPFAGRCMIRQEARTRQTIWSPVVLRPMTSPLTAFFWLSKIRGPKVAGARSSALLAVAKF